MQGLQNLGSTCAINSLIQIICRTQTLRDIILSDLPANAILSNALKEIVTMMHVNGNSLVPRKFINTLFKEFEGIFRKGEQLDIGELWIFMFDKIATELSVDFINLVEPESKVHNECNEIMSKFNNNKSSKWLESSQGIIVNIIKCNNCENVVYNFEPFTSISIDIVNGNTPSVIDMLQDYLCSEERVADVWKCDKCNKCCNYTKSVKIWRAPKILVLIVKRFSNEYQKNINPIKINKSIIFNEGTVMEKTCKFNYNLSAIGSHYGNLHGGHYNAWCNMCDGTYINYDDLTITRHNENEIDVLFENNFNAYMIVYELR